MFHAESVLQPEREQKGAKTENGSDSGEMRFT